MSSTTPGSEPERPQDATGHEPPGTEPDVAPLDESQPSDAGEPAPEPGAPVETSEPVVSAEPVEAAPAPPTPPEETPDATARLDAAVERANAVPVASDADDTGEVAGVVPEPVPAESVRRETYVPAATVVAGAAGAATLAPEPEIAPAAPAPVPQTVYVQAPTPPKPRANRAFGALVALIGTVIFALLYAGVAYLMLTVYGAGRADLVGVFTDFVISPVFWAPILAFFVGFALLAAIVNRGAWWNYAVFGLLVAVLVYFAYIGGALLTVRAWTLSLDDATEFLVQRWLDPFAIAAFIIAREIPIWLGGWIAARGRTVTERNRLAREAYDRELAAGPQPQRY
ncbi:hypothetical protein [Agromyces bauzanensis]